MITLRRLGTDLHALHGPRATHRRRNFILESSLPSSHHTSRSYHQSDPHASLEESGDHGIPATSMTGVILATAKRTKREKKAGGIEPSIQPHPRVEDSTK